MEARYSPVVVSTWYIPAEYRIDTAPDPDDRCMINRGPTLPASYSYDPAVGA